MRFNSPPNWPQPPEGWTPPPGWEPDPSWPSPPYGWRLWVEDEEFVISPHHDGPPRMRSTRSPEPWHRRTVSVVLLLVFFFPVGLILLWLRHDWSVRLRGIVTAVVATVMLIALVPSTPPSTTTALSPTTTSATTPPPPTSPAPALSPSPSPSPVVTTSSAPATSAPPKTTAPAPVRTSAAPVRTTRAPQPVQTTEQAQQGCYPLTSGGNCYKPGEYCRKADHGTTGVDGNGDAIVCEDNNGWRWERE